MRPMSYKLETIVRRSVAAWLAVAAAMAATVDGPYLRYGESDRLEVSVVEWSAAGATARGLPLAPSGKLTVPAVGALPSFEVAPRPPAKPAPDSLRLPKATPLFVVADTHGEYEILGRMLRAHRVIDAKSKWSFGRGHLVVLGDVFDRGPNHTEILWLLYQLEAEAAQAGGGVHLLIGNHEAMVLRGDLRYLNPKYRETALALGVGYEKLFDARSVLGQWLRSRPAILRIDRTLYLHGGISRALVDRKLTLAQINGTIRGLLDGTLPDDLDSLERAQFLLKEEGPLWYRGYFSREQGPDKGAATATSADIAAALKHFAADRIVVGHTIVPTLTPLYDGRVIAANVAAKPDAGGSRFEALSIRGSKMQRARLDGTTSALD
jgi:hypothetical protein